jgi:hypothetical protein
MGKMNGQGACWWADGTVYKGTWKNCIKEGSGQLSYADGSIYSGEFKEDFPDGKGRKVFEDESNYIGDFKNGLFHGNGKYKQPHLNIEYEGCWVRNEMKGQGVKKVNNGMLEIGGQYENGTVNGKGHKKWRKEGTSIAAQTFYIYRGNLTNNQINGFGEFKWPDGRHYIGDFMRAQMHGNGKLSWSEGDVRCVYKGQMFANVI